MDIHRCRFIEYPPAAINALAFSHTVGSKGLNNPLRLAIGRANGDIEIWNPKGGVWIHEITIRGGRERSVESLAWIQEQDTVNDDGSITRGRLRLFSIGYSSSVTEWNLCTGLPLQHSTGSHSEVWSLAAQPPCRKEEMDEESRSKGQSLIAGCADGTLVLLSTADGGLNFQKYIARPSKKRARALCITFQNRNTIMVGFADSAIRVYDIGSGKLIRTMSLGSGSKTGPKETLVWAIECLKDDTIVSGDSTGQVCFWDGKTYGQLQRIKSHEADVLCLTASEDGRVVFSGGADRRTVVYNLTNTPGVRKKWVKVSHRRYHQHDVKAMTHFENKRMSVVVSGGLDTQPIVIPLREFRSEHHRTLPFTPQHPSMSSAGRSVISWWENQIDVWRIGIQKRERERLIGSSEYQPEYKLISRILLKGDEHISCASISTSGSLLAVGTASECKIFEFRRRAGVGQHTWKSKKLDLPSKLSKDGIKLLKFSPDSRWILTVGLDNTLCLWSIELETGVFKFSGPIRIKRRNRNLSRQDSLNGDWGSYDQTITRAVFSNSSRAVAVSDLSGYIDTWVLESLSTAIASKGGNSDSNSDSDSSSDEFSTVQSQLTGLTWRQTSKEISLPRLSSHALILSFRPKSTDENLLVVTATHEIYEYSITKGRLTDWSRRNPPSELPEPFTIQKERAMGCFWDITSARQRVWLYGATWLCMFDLLQDYPSSDSSVNGTMAITGKKRRRNERGNVSSSGAGDLVPDHELRSDIVSRRIRKVDPETGQGEWIDVKAARKSNVMNGDTDMLDAEMEEEEEVRELNGNSDLHKLRRSEALATNFKSSENNHEIDDSDDENDDHNNHDQIVNHEADLAVAKGHDPAAQQTAFYISNKYRPILGIVPLSNEHINPIDESKEVLNGYGYGDSDDDNSVLEVALVERPLWDLDLPPRFVGNQEWKR